MLKLNLYTRR
jgi:hypothetical protein